MKIREYTRDDGHVIAVYESGAEYDMTTKKLVNSPKSVQITKENAIAMQARKQQNKRARIEAGAMAAVQDKMPDAFTGDDGDWIEAVAQQVAYKALDKLDPKQVDAARFLLQEAGLSDKQQQEQRQDDMMQVIMRLADLAGQALAGDIQRIDVIDGETVDGRAGAAGGGDDGVDDGG